jgi:hypothetical protein
VRSWDALAIPRPFSRVRCLFGTPLVVPPDLPPDALHPHACRLQAELDRLTAAAEDWADTGRLVLPPPIPQALPPAPVVQHPPAPTVAGTPRVP